MKSQPAKDVRREIRAFSASARAACLVDGWALPSVGLARAGAESGEGAGLQGEGWSVYNCFLICSLRLRLGRSEGHSRWNLDAEVESHLILFNL